MQLTVNPNMDVIRLETYLKTDVAHLGIWNSEGMKWISSGDIYAHEFIPTLNDNQEKIQNCMIAAETGIDGNFKTIIYINQDLSVEDKRLLYKSEKGITLNINSPVLVGSIGDAGYMQDSAIKNNYIDIINLPNGKYVVDAHSLLIKDEAGKPQFLNIVFCIFSEVKYAKFGTPTRVLSKSISLKYSG